MAAVCSPNQRASANAPSPCAFTPCRYTAAVDLLAPVVDGMPRVLCCHRSRLSGKFAPNSLAAVEDCVRNGAPRIEIDVRFLEDDSMLVFHDSILDEETTGHGRVDALDRASARALHYRFDVSSTLCFLDEVVALARGSESLLQVDLKLFRPITPARVALLSDALKPLGDRALIGSQAHWNLRPLARLGHRVALDPTLQWHFDPDRGPDFYPGAMGVYGMWDDSPIAHNRRFGPDGYFETRIDEICGLLPSAEEWMVDIDTIRHMAKLSFNLGAALAGRGISLAAWTLHDLGPEDTSSVLGGLFENGVTTVITDDALTIAGYLGNRQC